MVDPERYRVTLLLKAPAPVAPASASAVVRLLEGRQDCPPPWATLLATTPGERDVRLMMTLCAEDAATAAGTVVDAVRARLGLDAVFARWVVDARHLSVTRELRHPT